jgi:predicted  nucleic acid-binding Zn-ribbon protein
MEHIEAAIRENAEAIAEVRARVDGHDDDIARQERHISKLDEQIVILRETVGRVATKDDIADLRKDVSDRFDKRAEDAHNSIPTKLAAWFGGTMVILTLLEFALGHWHG